MNNVFRSDDIDIYLNIPYCEFYIPMYYFDDTRKFAEDLNTEISVLGIFSVGLFENGKLYDTKILNLPTMITINVYDSELREVKMPNDEILQCKVVKYIKDQKIMKSTLFEDDVNSKKYLKFITSGYLPKFLPYSKTRQIWEKNQTLNGVDFGVSSLYLELILSVVYRNPNDLSQKFSTIASNEGVSDFDYTTASIRQICQYNSTFTALTFEDFDSMATSSLNKSRNKMKERYSPVEDIIKY